MRVSFAKTFHFSASHEKNGKVYGHNYALTITTDSMTDAQETVFENTIKERFIDQIHTKDLGLHVDFLRSIDISDEKLLKIFFQIIEKLICPAKLCSLSLKRDDRTEVTLAL